MRPTCVTTVRLLPIALLLSALTLVLVALPAPFLAAQSVQRETLGSGLTLVVREQAVTRAVELVLMLRAGPLSEDEHLGTGISAVLQRVLLDAARRGRLGEHLRPLAEGLRSKLDLATTRYALTVSDDDLDLGLELLATLAVWDGYDADDLARAKAVVAGDGLRYQRPWSREDRHVLRTIFQRHPVRVPLHGLPELVAEVDLDDLRRWQRRSYVQPQATVVIVGNVPDERARIAVSQAFARLPARGWAAPAVVAEPPQYAERHAVHAAPVAQDRHIYGWRAVEAEHPDQVVLAVIAAHLGSPQFSPLLRTFEQGQLASGLRVESLSGPGHPGVFVISYQPFPGRGAESWLALQQELDRLAQDGIDAGSLAAAKNRLHLEWLRSLSTAAGIAEDLARWEASVGVPDYSKVVHAAIASVSSADVKRVAGRRLHPNGFNRTKIVLTPRDGSAAPAQPAALVLTDVPPVLIQDLPGGARLLHRALPLGVVHLQVTIAGGRAADPRGAEGTAGLLASLLRSGSTTRSGDDLARQLAAIGIDLSTRHSDHTIEVELVCFPTDVDRALAILVDLIRTPALPAADLQRRVQTTQAALLTASASWRERLLAAVRSGLLSDHYAGIPPAVIAAGLSQVDRGQLVEHHRRLAVGANLVFTVVGDCDRVQVADRLRELLSAEPGLVAGEPWRPEGQAWPEQPAPAVSTVTWERSGPAAVALAWRAPALEDLAEDAIALDLLLALLVGEAGRGGRLRDAIVARQLGVDELGLWRGHFAGRGVLAVLARLEGEARPEIVAEALRQSVASLVAALLQEEAERVEPSPEELAEARRNCLVARVLAEEDHARIAAAQARGLLLHGDIEAEVAYADQLASVGREDLQRVARRYLAAEPLEVRLLSPAQADETGEVEASETEEAEP